MPTLPLSNTASRDANMNALQVGYDLVMQDGAGTPIVSPKTSVGTTPQLFTPPTGAVAFIFNCSAAARYGKHATLLDGSGAGKGYKVAAASTDTMWPCAGGLPIYVRSEAGTITIDFTFVLLG